MCFFILYVSLEGPFVHNMVRTSMMQHLLRISQVFFEEDRLYLISLDDSSAFMKHYEECALRKKISFHQRERMQTAWRSGLGTRCGNSVLVVGGDVALVFITISFPSFGWLRPSGALRVVQRSDLRKEISSCRQA